MARKSDTLFDLERPQVEKTERYVSKSSGVCGHEGAGGKGESDDWITPRWIIEALGPFDLDPCESDSHPWKCASAAFHKPEGLLRPWFGRVWCNPPYGQQLGDWLCRCADHGDAIALTFARTETRHFFTGVWGRASGILFLRGRLRFHRPDGQLGASGTGPSVLIAYGDENARRIQSLDAKYGRFVKP